VYGLDDRGIGVWFLAGTRGFFLPYSIQTRSGGKPGSSIMGTISTLSGGEKPSGLEPDQSPPSTAEDKKVWSYTSTHQYVFTAWWSVKPKEKRKCKGKGKIPMLNYLRTTPWRRMGEWRLYLHHSWPWYQTEMSGQVHAPAALLLRKESRVSIR
jgi:hypothetical protein